MNIRDAVQFGTTRIDYEIIYSNKRRNASLAVYPMKHVEISVPRATGREDAQRLVKKKGRWIIKQWLWFDEIAQLDSVKELVNGETFLYLGRQYRLKITREDGKAEAQVVGKYLLVKIPIKLPVTQMKRTVKAAIWQWYRNRASEKITELLQRYSKKLGINEPQFMIKNQYKRWGSCTSKNMLIFNLRVVMAPASQIEYVVAHELCHTKCKDHSPSYWKLLRTLLPDYDGRKEALRKEGWQYTL